MLSSNIGNYLTKRQSERYLIIVNSKHLLYILYITAKTIISCKEQIAWLLAAMHHGNMQELACLGFLKLNLEYQNKKNEKRHI